MALKFKSPLAARINGVRVDLLKDLEKVTVDVKVVEAAKVDWDWYINTKVKR